MFTYGQKVICINDNFHPSIVEWADQIPKRGHIYTVLWIRPRARDAVTGELGPGLYLVELRNPEDRVCFSAWRFVPQDGPGTTARLDEKAGEESQEPTLPPVPELEPATQTELPAMVITPARLVFAREWIQRLSLIETPCEWAPPPPSDFHPDGLERLRALATVNEPIRFEGGVVLEPGQFQRELAMMRVLPTHWPSLGVVEILYESGLLRRAEECLWRFPEPTVRVNPGWHRRLRRFSAKIIAAAEAAGIHPCS
jgi:hypothetical protein